MLRENSIQNGECKIYHSRASSNSEVIGQDTKATLEEESDTTRSLFEHYSNNKHRSQIRNTDAMKTSSVQKTSDEILSSSTSSTISPETQGQFSQSTGMSVQHSNGEINGDQLKQLTVTSVSSDDIRRIGRSQYFPPEEIGHQNNPFPSGNAPTTPILETYKLHQMPSSYSYENIHGQIDRRETYPQSDNNIKEIASAADEQLPLTSQVSPNLSTHSPVYLNRNKQPFDHNARTMTSQHGYSPSQTSTAPAHTCTDMLQPQQQDFALLPDHRTTKPDITSQTTNTQNGYSAGPTSTEPTQTFPDRRYPQQYSVSSLSDRHTTEDEFTSNPTIFTPVDVEQKQKHDISPQFDQRTHAGSFYEGYVTSLHEEYSTGPTSLHEGYGTGPTLTVPTEQYPHFQNHQSFSQLPDHLATHAPVPNFTAPKQSFTENQYHQQSDGHTPGRTMASPIQTHSGIQQHDVPSAQYLQTAATSQNGYAAVPTSTAPIQQQSVNEL